jgi:hypothetical protein
VAFVRLPLPTPPLSYQGLCLSFSGFFFSGFYWQLDVTFREDHCRIRKGHADTNFSTLRRTALSMLKNEKTKKLGIKNKRLSAGWDEPYLFKVLFGA